MMAITAKTLRTALPKSKADFDVLAPLLDAAAKEFGIVSPLQQAAWLAQLAHESGEFTRLVESFAYRDPTRLPLVFKGDFRDLADAKAVHAKGQQAIANRVYANQNGNGPESSGDGWKYRGRSYIQTTGRANYKRTGDGIGLDLIAKPELLADPKHACRAAGFFWKDNNLNKWVDAGDYDGLSDAINMGRKTAKVGDSNGWDDRVAKFAAIKKAMGL